ncbi:MAG: hypothetical protein J7K98_03115 [Candidatus Aenigmarchaeota archaeon]|nr:hypothetical protein [Candidatus Aenigmarchaeota archaeon]
MAWPLTKIGPLSEELMETVKKYNPKTSKTVLDRKYDPHNPYDNPQGLEIVDGGFYFCP